MGTVCILAELAWLDFQGLKFTSSLISPFQTTFFRLGKHEARVAELT
jgi:hypothetical protein